MKRLVAAIGVLGLLLVGCVASLPTPATFAVRQLLTGDVSSVVVADVTGDGRADLLATQQGESIFDGVTHLLLYRQLPNHTLASPLAFSLGPYQSAGFIATGDFNGDGLTDVAVDVSGDKSSNVRFFYQRSGTLVPGGLLSGVNCAFGRIVPVDLNHDGTPELLTTGCNGISVWQRGPGTAWRLEQALGLNQYDSSTDFAVADFNGDGRPDIVGDGPYTIWAAYLGANGRFGFAVTVAPACVEPGDGATDPFLGVVGGDVTGDGHADVVCVTDANSPDSVDVYQQLGSSISKSPHLYGADEIPAQPVIGDLNKDGRNDVVVLHNYFGEIGIYTQQSNGTLGAEQLVTGVAVSPEGSQAFPETSLAVADLNGDGKPDIAAGGMGGIEILWQQ